VYGADVTVYTSRGLEFALDAVAGFPGLYRGQVTLYDGDAFGIQARKGEFLSENLHPSPVPVGLYYDAGFTDYTSTAFVEVVRTFFAEVLSIAGAYNVEYFPNIVVAILDSRAEIDWIDLRQEVLSGSGDYADIQSVYKSVLFGADDSGTGDDCLNQYRSGIHPYETPLEYNDIIAILDTMETPEPSTSKDRIRDAYQDYIDAFVLESPSRVQIVLPLNFLYNGNDKSAQLAEWDTLWSQTNTWHIFVELSEIEFVGPSAYAKAYVHERWQEWGLSRECRYREDVAFTRISGMWYYSGNGRRSDYCLSAHYSKATTKTGVTSSRRYLKLRLVDNAVYPIVSSTFSGGEIPATVLEQGEDQDWGREFDLDEAPSIYDVYTLSVTYGDGVDDYALRIYGSPEAGDVPDIEEPDTVTINTDANGAFPLIVSNLPSGYPFPGSMSFLFGEDVGDTENLTLNYANVPLETYNYDVNASSAITGSHWLEIEVTDVYGNSSYRQREYDFDFGPAAIIVEPAGVGMGNMDIEYYLREIGSHTCSIAAEFTVIATAKPYEELVFDDLTWETAEPDDEAPAHDGITGLSTSPAGDQHTFVWDTTAVPGGIGATSSIRVIFRITPTDEEDPAAGSIEDVTGYFVVNNTDSVACWIVQPEGVQDEHVHISYYLADSDSDFCTIIVEYSTNSGISWFNATMGIDGNGTAGLNTLPGGILHDYSWDSRADLGMTMQDDIRIRITPTDEATGIAAETGNFTVSNGVNTPPDVEIETPIGMQDRDITFNYTLFDYEFDLCDVFAQYTVPGEEEDWSDCTLSGFSFSLTDQQARQAPPDGAGTSLTFMWDTLTDIGYAPQGFYIVRIRARDEDDALSDWVQTGVINVWNFGIPEVEVTELYDLPDEINDGFSGTINLQIMLFDEESDPCNIHIEYSTTGPNGPWEDGMACEEFVDVPSSPGGLMYNVHWDPVEDLGVFYSDEMHIRVTPGDFQTPYGTPVVTAEFILQNHGARFVITEDSLENATWHHRGVVLDDGRILVVSGHIGSSTNTKKCYIYDQTMPEGDRLMKVAEVNKSRHCHALVLLKDGRVLVAGGHVYAEGAGTVTAELYSPPTTAEILANNLGSWTYTGNMTNRRHWCWGAVIDGGTRDGWAVFWSSADNTQARRVDIYNPATGTFSWIDTYSGWRRYICGVAAVPGDGRVVAAGGYKSDSSTQVGTTWYDGDTNSCDNRGTDMPYRRGMFWMFATQDGTLIAGGGQTAAPDDETTSGAATIDEYDPVADTWTTLCDDTTGDGGARCYEPPIAELENGDIFIYGGRHNNMDDSWKMHESGAIYSRSRDDTYLTSDDLGGNNSNEGRTITQAYRLDDGTVITIGGYRVISQMSTVEMFYPPLEEDFPD